MKILTRAVHCGQLKASKISVRLEAIKGHFVEVLGLHGQVERDLDIFGFMYHLSIRAYGAIKNTRGH